MKNADGTPKNTVEQATFEWLNSDFADNGKTPKSCQDCHMPTSYKDTPLSYKVANIEDKTFPAVDFRSADASITLKERNPYARHLLLGINVFALEMFKQFRAALGLYAVDPMLRDPDKTVDGVDTAIEAAVDIANNKTAQVKIETVLQSSNLLLVDVRVTNLAGHSFPSGVSFRRAFLNFQLIGPEGEVVWESGRTDAEGVILNGSGYPLRTEFFSPTQQSFQPHYWQDNPITRQDQVQIYEELSVNPEGALTTSFLSLDHKVKDNRLQPTGWSPAGPDAAETGPVGACVGDGAASKCDPGYSDGSGSNVVRYEIPLGGFEFGNCKSHSLLPDDPAVLPSPARHGCHRH